MRKIAIIASILLAGCGSRSEPGLVNTTEIARARPQAPVERWNSWKPCEKPAFNAFGNKWWSGLSACEGGVAVDFESDSVLHGGPTLRLTIRTPACPEGKGAGLRAFEHAFFEKPFAAQLREVKAAMRQLLSEIDAECGGPIEASGLFGAAFDEKFRDLAEGWLRLLAKERRRAWASVE